jgi:hypothetical protein
VRYVINLNGVPTDPFQTAAQVDAVVSARRFHAEKCPFQRAQNAPCECEAHELSRLVHDHMIHDCSKAACATKTKKKCPYPFSLCPISHVHQPSGRWHYQRLNTDDANVVPHSPALLLRFKAHINVEIVTDEMSHSYLFKYQAKIAPSSIVRLQQTNGTSPGNQERNQMNEYFRAQVVSSSEATCRFLDKHTFGLSPCCKILDLHLPGCFRMQHDLDDSVDDVAAKLSAHVSTLEHYFARHSSLLSLTYQQYHKQYDFASITTNTPATALKHRDGSLFFSAQRPEPCFARISGARCGSSDATSIELSCLRKLLLHFPFHSFEQAQGEHESFVSAASANGLHDYSSEHIEAMQFLINKDAAWHHIVDSDDLPRCHVPEHAVQALFVRIVLGDTIDNVQDFFDQFWFYMHPRSTSALRHNQDGTVQQYKNDVLVALQSRLSLCRRTCEDTGLPTPRPHPAHQSLIEAERQRYSDDQLNEDFAQLPQLNSEQEAFLTKATTLLINASTQPQHRLLFLTGAAGCGKTATIKHGLIRWRRQGFTIVPAAFMATCADPLDGCTLHKLFGLPVSAAPLHTLHSTITSTTDRRAQFLTALDGFIFEESSMMHLEHLRMADELLQALTGVATPFGGKFIVFVGDFRQIPPVDEGTNDASSVSVVSAPWWKHVQTTVLSVNHRRQQPVDDDTTNNDNAQAHFSNYVERIGVGFALDPDSKSFVQRDGYYRTLPPDTRQVTTHADVYSAYLAAGSSPQTLCKRIGGSSQRFTADTMRHRHAPARGGATCCSPVRLLRIHQPRFNHTGT